MKDQEEFDANPIEIDDDYQADNQDVELDLEVGS